MTTRRIAIVSDWFAPRRGGIESQLGQLCDRLSVRGHDVEVLTTTPGASGGRNFRVQRLDVLRLPIQDVAVSPRMLTILRDRLRQYDVVHAHVSVISPLGYVAAYVGRSLGLPVVVTFHSVLHSKAILLRAASWIAGLRERGVCWTAVSRHVAAQASNALGVPVGVLANGIDLEYWRTKSGAAPPPEPVTLVSTMRFQRKKRPRQLIRAFANASARSATPARLLLVGDGPARGAIERDVDLYGLRSGRTRVDVRGWLDVEGCRAAYHAAHGFVLASRAESFGIAALEARATGLPVIAMHGGISEFLTHETDALFCADDAELEAAFVRFIGDATLRQQLCRCSADLSRYDWGAVISAHEEAYAAATRTASAGAVAWQSA